MSQADFWSPSKHWNAADYTPEWVITIARWIATFALVITVFSGVAYFLTKELSLAIVAWSFMLIWIFVGLYIRGAKRSSPNCM